jgi:hypothetical protein
MNNELTLEQQKQAANVNFNENQIDNKHLIPSLKSQIYSMGQYFDRDGEEKLFIDSYSEERSTLVISKNDNVVVYDWETLDSYTPSEGEEIENVETLPTAGLANLGKIYSTGTDPQLTYSKCVITSGTANPNSLVSTDIVKASISLSNSMLKLNPVPNIVIDGREYTSGIAGTQITFYMNRDHRISILWNENTVETFLIVANR